MIKKEFKGGFFAVPFHTVIGDGLYREWENKNLKWSGKWGLVAPNGQAVDDENGHAYAYASWQEAQASAESLLRSGDCSTCGGVIKLREDTQSDHEVVSRLQSDVDRLEEVISDYEEDLYRYRGQIDELKTQKRQLSHAVEKLQAKCDSQTSQMADREATIFEMGEALGTRDARVVMIKKREVDAQKRIKQLEKDLAEQSDRHRKLSHENATLRALLRAAPGVVAPTERAPVSEESVEFEPGVETAALQAHFARVTQEVKDVVARNWRLVDENKVLRGENADLRNRFTVVENAIPRRGENGPSA